jgi:nicotinate-nucleotide--dimethylbenzimidazole phosphoribosyltransferase
VSVFSGESAEHTCGAGTGLDEAARARKVAVVEEALARHRPRPDAPIEALACVGGLEIAAMTGFLLRSAAHGLPIVLDGFVTNAAALAAQAIDPRVTQHLLASHQSAERGASIALRALGLEPLLSLGLRLGEGTGALLAMDLVDAALSLHTGMATFATAGVVRGDA